MSFRVIAFTPQGVLKLVRNFAACTHERGSTLKSFFAQNRKFEKPKPGESIPIVLRYARKKSPAYGGEVWQRHRRWSVLMVRTG